VRKIRDESPDLILDTLIGYGLKGGAPGTGGGADSLGERNRYHDALLSYLLRRRKLPSIADKDLPKEAALHSE
jgi:hypothetical protein